MNQLSAESSLKQWLAYLEKLHPTEIELGLGRIKQVAKALGLTYPYVSITVAGTNGKGSVCAMLDSILKAGGYKTGTYASPHLIHYNERIRVNGEFASDSQIVAQFYRIEQARGNVSLSYFEFSTLAALLIFEQEKIDVAVLEVGLGGRLDAVNIVDADCSVITSIDIDHSEYLGNTRSEVAFEKAHIFRSGKPAICADPQPPESLIKYAEQIGADLWLFGKDFNYSGDQLQWAYGGRNLRRSALAYPALRGANQLLNASAALAVLEALRPALVVPAHALRLGLLHAVLPGRFQIMPGQPTVILDVAHNPHAASALSHNLANMPCTGKTYAVVGMLNNKDTVGVISRLVGSVDYWLCASLAGTRGLNANSLSAIVEQQIKASKQQALQHDLDDIDTINISPDQLNGKGPSVKPAVRVRKVINNPTTQSFDDPVTAFNFATKNASVNDRILVFGSFATVGPVLEKISQSTG